MNSDLEFVGLVVFSYCFIARNQRFLRARLGDSVPGIVGLSQKTCYLRKFSR
jgi:hypothetical protein